MAIDRMDLEPARVGYEMAYVLGPYTDAFGRAVDVSGYTITATAVKDDGSTYVVPTITKLTQDGLTLGCIEVVVASSDLAAATTATPWKLDVFYAASGGNARPIVERYQFHVEAKETAA